MNLYESYVGLLRWTLDVVGVSRSIAGKVLTAVGIQFAVSVALTLVFLVFSGALRLWLIAGLFGLAIVAFLNTVVIVRDDLIEPVLDLQAAARRIGEGDLDVDVPATDQRDELGDLHRSFAEMQAQLAVVADQAEALAHQEFDDPVLDRNLPGRFGEILGRMTDELTAYVDRVETDRDRFKLLNFLVGHDVSNLLTVVYGRLELLRETCDESAREDVDVIDDQIREIEAITTMVADLTTEESVRRIDVTRLLRRDVQRIRESYPAAEVSFSGPQDPVELQGNELLSRAFENLIVNGIEHDGGAPSVDVTVTQSDGHVEVAVADDGPGLDVEDGDELVEATDDMSGLRIVDMIVTAFDGDLRLEESTSAGSTFLVRLPR